MLNTQAFDDTPANDRRMARNLLAAKLPTSKHAKTRSQQRGISDMEIDLLRTFGACAKAHDGCLRYFLDKTAKRRVANYVGVPGVAEALAARFIVVSPADLVITVGHRTERIRRPS